MNSFGDTCPPGGLVASTPNRFRVDRLIAVMILAARKEPSSGFSPQAVPVLAQFVEQLGAEHDIAILASLAALDMNHHTLAVDITVRHVSGVECHQSSVKRGARGIDELRDFFLAEDSGEAVGLFRVGSLGDTPSLFERLDVKEPQGSQIDRDAVR